MSAHYLAAPHRNLVSAASGSGTAPRPSAAIRRSAVSRTGNGLLRLAGAFAGEQDAQIDLEIVAGSTLRMSSPVHAGVGSGAISDLAVLPGATAQQYTITLIDPGTTTATAIAEIEGYIVEARAEGAGGNQIQIEVDDSGLIYTPTDYSLLDDLAQGAEDMTGAGWDWDSAAGTPGLVPATAKRVSIGDDHSVVYRQWREYRDGEWHYMLSPAAVRTYLAGERIYEVSGGRTVTVTDDVNPETYPDIVTLRDLLVALESSALVRPQVIPSPDMTADNLAAIQDLRLRTVAHIKQTTGTSEHARGFINHFAGPAAATEVVEAECYAATTQEGAGLGSEKWAIFGTVSGDLGKHTTGDTVIHPSGRWGLTIPTRLPIGWGDQNGEITSNVEYVARDEGETEPPICVDQLLLGVGAYDRQIKFVYTKRPDGACDCTNTSWDRLPAATSCLGIDPVEETDMSNLAAGYAVRLQKLDDWYNTAAGSQGVISGELLLYYWDVDLAEGARSILLDVLTQIFNTGVLSWPIWTASAEVSRDEIREPITRNNYRYRATIPGATGAIEPATWPTIVGDTVVDGAVTWECLGKTPEAAWDDLLSAIAADFSSLEGLTENLTSDTTDSGVSSAVNQYLRRYEAWARPVLAAAEIVGSFSSASSTGIGPGSACWQDPGDTHWWVPEDADLEPAFTNQEYVSVRLVDGEIVSTKEFGMVIKVECSVSLKEGDSVTITIGNAGWDPTYQKGDKLLMEVVAASPLGLGGGVTGTDTHTWSVYRSVDGVGADYVQDLDSPGLYEDTEVEFRLAPGGIPHQVGDTWTFCVEAGAFTWRQDAGGWSADQPLADGALVDGLSVEVVDGACPSWVAGDSVSYQALQPHTFESVYQPDGTAHAWDGDSWTRTLQLTGTVDGLILAEHELPEGVTITLTGAVSRSLDWRSGPIATLFEPALTDPEITITITGTGAGGSSIGWLWAGTLIALPLAEQQSRRRVHTLERGEGRNPSGQHLGAGWSHTLEWGPWIDSALMSELLGALDAAMGAGDYPLVLIPHTDRADEAELVRMPEALEMPDLYAYQDTLATDRAHSLRLELRPWYSTS